MHASPATAGRVPSVLLRPKLRALLAQEGLLEKSMASLEKAANGKGLKDGESQAQVRWA